MVWNDFQIAPSRLNQMKKYRAIWTITAFGRRSNYQHLLHYLESWAVGDGAYHNTGMWCLIALNELLLLVQ